MAAVAAWPDQDWIPAGTRFGVDDMVFHQGKGERPLDAVLAEVDLVITGPHATGDFPAELAPFVHHQMTRRLQHDFCDRSTAPVARRWTELDSRVLYVEDPHPRAVRDANRPRPDDVETGLREAFRRLRKAGESWPSLTGVDAIRPVTFAYLPVLVEPTTDAEWAELVDALVTSARRGVDVYERVRDDLIERVLEAKLRRLVTLDPGATDVASWRSAVTLHVLSLHDTMNTTARPDGAVADQRRPLDRLPDLVALSNRGDDNGEVRASAEGVLVEAGQAPTMAPNMLRALATAHRRAFGVPDAASVVLNHPYLGGYEVGAHGALLASLADRAVVRHPQGGLLRIEVGAYQAEYLREVLLGEAATEVLLAPGEDWPEVPVDHIDHVARGMKLARDEFRRWGQALDGSSR